MSRHDRLSQIVDLVIGEGSVHVDDIVEKLGVSGATARRDLDTLASQQLVTRTRGGAVANSSSGELPLRYRATKQGEEKRRIAAAAVQTITPGEVIALNGGTTTTEMALELGIQSASDPRFAQTQVTVVTNAINIASDLTVRPQIRVVVTGGVARSRSYELSGPLSTLILPRISIDTLYLGISGIVPQQGLFTDNEAEAITNGAFVDAARRVIVIADRTKVGARAFARISDLDKVSTLITDSQADSAIIEQLRSAGITCVLV